MTDVQDSASRLPPSQLLKRFALYAIVAIAMGPLWCLVLSIPISAASTMVGPNRLEMAILTGVSAVASAIVFPLLHSPLTKVRVWVWPIFFSLIMAIIFAAAVIFISDWQVSAPGERSIFFELLLAVFYGVEYGTIAWLGSVHVAYPMAMLHLWVLNRVLGNRGHPQNRV